MPLTLDQLKAIIPNATAANLAKYLVPINNAMDKYMINTPLRMAHFIAQLAHESGSLRYNYEIWSNPALDARGVATAGASWQLRYEGRADLGNTEPGDGYRFRGRGLIQLTGRANYSNYGISVGQSFTTGNNPDLVAQPDRAADVAGWFWNRGRLNVLADADDILRITKKINGGTNGLKDRQDFLARAKSVLKIS